MDRISPVPLYFQLSQQLEAAIERGRLTPGSLLGNEIELAGRLGLSRPTVRQAIQSLVDKGLLVRRRGVGTQVVHSQVKRPLELSSLYDDLEAAGQRPATRVLATTSCRPPPRSRPRSACPRAATFPCRAAAARPRRADGVPAQLPARRACSTLDDTTAGGDRPVPDDARRRDHPAQRPAVRRRAGATAEEAERLAEPAGAPLLTMQRTTFDDTGRAVEFGTHIYRASRYSFEFQLPGRGRNEPAASGRSDTDGVTPDELIQQKADGRELGSSSTSSTSAVTARPVGHLAGDTA